MATLAEMRARRQQTLTLAHSGLEVTARRLTLTDLAARGQIPTPLHAQVAALIGAAEAGKTPPISVATFPQHAAVIDLVAAAALVRPAVVDDPAAVDDDHVLITELPFEDRLQLFSWAQEAASAVATFSGDAAGERPAA